MIDSICLLNPTFCRALPIVSVCHVFSMSHPWSSSHLKGGWLRKHGGMVQKWQRRWFVLNGDCLFYFAKDDDVRTLGSIFLPGNKVVRHEFNADDPDKFLFEVVSGNFMYRSFAKKRRAKNRFNFIITE